MTSPHNRSRPGPRGRHLTSTPGNSSESSPLFLDETPGKYEEKKKRLEIDPEEKLKIERELEWKDDQVMSGSGIIQVSGGAFGAAEKSFASGCVQQLPSFQKSGIPRNFI